MTNSTAWSEPESAATVDSPPVYPYNNATATKSGHLFELDDTPKRERIRLQHRSGTFFEFHPNGDYVFKAPSGSIYEIISNGDKHVYVKGKCILNVEGDYSVEVKGNYNLKVDGDYTESFGGHVNKLSNDSSKGNSHTVDGDHEIIASGDLTLGTQSSITEGNKVIINGDLIVNGTIKGNQTISSVGNINTQADVYAQGGLRTFGHLLVGAASLMPGPVPGVHIITEVVNIESPVSNIFGLLNVFGLVTVPDVFFEIPGTFFSVHIHPGVQSGSSVTAPPL